MAERLILLTGWATSPAALEPLRAALHARAPYLEVRLEPLPALARPGDWLEALDARLPRDGWLGGWSLGGMLAAQLAARRGAACRGLIGLCSNVCFRARAGWPQAMPADVFDAFRQACRLDAEQTLKRFTLLVAQGGGDARSLARQLQLTQPILAPAVLDAGLQLLAELDGRAALETYPGPQLHLFAGRDALVPAAAAQALLDWLPDVEVQCFAAASHGLPLEQPEELAGAILAFMREGDHG
ncbi:alpha/beta fold hydrolase [Zestomonas thermotolerans]|uniref:alpha/beta fold hydrolase n=1 Tax=Zestomonas thermotolerans TaxID=157784 RepID=UPI0023F43B9D|nr:alpha/beta fold hydrolase [Pseudomonas thermotolerans]